MASDTELQAEAHQPGSVPKVILLLETADQQQSLNDPIRRQILNVLGSGVVDYTVQTKTDTRTLDDGTDVTHHVEVRTPFKRYWMTVPEIIEELNSRQPVPKITNYQCYYHLEKLRDQELVVQDPALSDKDRDQKIRVRGKRFRTAARFFVSNYSKTSVQDFERLLDFLDRGWGVNPSKEDEARLRELLSKQDKHLLNALEHLASQLAENELDQVTFPVQLERLAYVYLSDDSEFLERNKETRDILIRSGGTTFDEDSTMVDSAAKAKARGVQNE
ncbi:MAG: hypothetical protein ACFFAY_11970 [Promethearchaeota archaeon]